MNPFARIFTPYVAVLFCSCASVALASSFPVTDTQVQESGESKATDRASDSDQTAELGEETDFSGLDIPQLLKRLQELNQAVEANDNQVELIELRKRGLAIFRQLEDAGLALENTSAEFQPLIADTLFHGACAQILSETQPDEVDGTEPKGADNALELFGRALEWGLPDCDEAINQYGEEEQARIRARLSQLEQKYERAAANAKKKADFILKLPGMEGFLEIAIQLGNQFEIDDLPEEYQALAHQHGQLLWQKAKLRSTLERLILVAPSRTDYKFELAQFLLAEPGSKARAISLLNEIAPLDKPGDGRAHLILGRHYAELAANVYVDKTKYMEMALANLGHCLELDENLNEVRSLRAGILVDLERFELARYDYELLVAEDPTFVVQLVELNAKLELEEENPKVLADAARTLSSKLDETPEDELAIYQDLVKTYVGVLQLQGRFQEADEFLNSAPERYKYVFDQLLIANYIAWAATYDYKEPTAVNAEEQFDLLVRAFNIDQDNEYVYFQIGRIAAGESELAETAQQINDIKRMDFMVLLQTATRFLQNKEPEPAIFYLELALEQEPDDPTTLNNLAYAYIISDSPRAELALTLVDRAIDGAAGNRSYYHDTRARALMQLERYSEAVEAFESAMEDRPDYPPILAGIIECYEKLEDPRADAFRARLRAIESLTIESAVYGD